MTATLRPAPVTPPAGVPHTSTFADALRAIVAQRVRFLLEYQSPGALRD